MKVKRYLVNDMNEAMIMIKNELGKDAIILSSRKVKGNGLFAIFGKAKFEVLAAIEEQVQLKDSEARLQSSDRDKSVIDTYMQVKAGSGNTQKQSEFNQLNQDLNELKQMVNQLVMKNGSPVEENTLIKNEPFKSGIDYPSFPGANKSAITEPSELTSIEQVRQWLIDRDVDKVHADKITDILFYNGEVPEDISKSLKMVIQKLLGKPFTIEKTDAKPKVCFFVGPTGVGKTTTLAKLAAKLSLMENKKIGLITSDTYRIAAVDQLKTYSEILGIPLTVIYEADELPSTLNKYMDRDYILIDTAGRSQNSKEFVTDVANLLEYVENPEIFLVISLTTGYKEISKILEAYSFLADYKLLFTKLDESSSLGNVLNARMMTNKSLSYFTIGQSVPDDIEIANLDKIVNYIVGD